MEVVSNIANGLHRSVQCRWRNIYGMGNRNHSTGYLLNDSG